MTFNNLHSAPYSRDSGGKNGFQSWSSGQKRQWSPDGNQGRSKKHQNSHNAGTQQRFNSQGGGQHRGGRGGNANQRSGRGNFYGNGSSFRNNRPQNHYHHQERNENINQNQNQPFHGSQKRHGEGPGGRGGFGAGGSTHGGSFGNAPNPPHNPFLISNYQNSSKGPPHNGDQSGLSHGWNSGRSRGKGSNFSNVNYFQNAHQGTEKTHWRSGASHDSFNRRESGRNRERGRGGRHSTPSINPFQHVSRPGNLEVVDYDNYDADDSSETDYEWSAPPPGTMYNQNGWPVLNPLEQIASSLDQVLFQLINNTPQYRSTIRRFMDGYSGPGDLEFWMNTLGVEYMNWEVLHEVDRLGLQLPPGWNCAAREFDERRMESNYSSQYLRGPHPGNNRVNTNNNFRFERHRGTFATPAAALLSNPNPGPLQESRPAPIFRFAVPEIPSTFSWGGQQVVAHAPPTAPSAMSHLLSRIPPASSFRFGA